MLCVKGQLGKKKQADKDIRESDRWQIAGKNRQNRTCVLAEKNKEFGLFLWEILYRTDTQIALKIGPKTNRYYWDDLRHSPCRQFGEKRRIFIFRAKKD